MKASRTDARPLPKVHEPRVLRCGHHITEEITGPEALALSHLVTDLNAIEIAAAVNAVPERQDATGTTAGTTAEAVREHLNSLKRRLRARTWTQMVDTACRMRLLLPPRAVLTTPLPETAVPTLQLLADGYTNQQIAVMRTVSPGRVGSHLEAIRHRMRTRGTPAAVYRLHGVVPAVLDATCPICATGDIDHDRPQCLRSLAPGQTCLLHAGATTRLTGSPDSAQLIASHAPAPTPAPTPVPGSAPLTPDAYRAAAVDAHERLTEPRPAGTARTAETRLEDIPDLRAADLPRIHAQSGVLRRLAADRARLSYLVTTTVLAPERYEASRTTLLLDRLVLSAADDLGYEIRLNTNPRPGNQVLPQNHAYPFTARVLTGGYLHTVFLRTDGRTDDRADGPFTSRDLRPAVTTTELPGSAYTLAPALVHRAVMLPGTTTLMLCGPYSAAAHAAADLIPPVSAWPAPVDGEAPVHSRRMTDAEHHALYGSLAAAGVIDLPPARR